MVKWRKHVRLKHHLKKVKSWCIITLVLFLCNKYIKQVLLIMFYVQTSGVICITDVECIIIVSLFVQRSILQFK